ncbi:uncharacterized protein K452DRAFT_293346 [Aplosporella prunicola CBS 121167]|uniref:HTH myb-type domain-containing protein n=1 Tax=Aplosporella prunicola CBS 121167 TaxID=1176127 RepID=A0A6A6AVM3_9PEZI|nr:uncharacterized protein K452DRAFT_293346 [Aplosporella prunicola CBS 121167]KAF2135278.1 hypothetical protein K452DRAFT_293346 [Aplosporella prunicola CBS 121167]
MMPQQRTRRRPWTSDEDAALRFAVAQSTGPVSWLDVASQVPGRNNKECRKRWVYQLSVPSRKGTWDAAEDERLREAIQQHGLRWASVAQHVATRQPDQCARRWHECIKPGINHGPWSLLDDQMLDEAVALYGNKWTEIVQRFFPDRTPLAAKSRHKQRFQQRDQQRDQQRGQQRDQQRDRQPDLLWLVPDHTQPFTNTGW